MASLTKIQNKIGSKIFEGLGSTATRKPYVSDTTDKYGDRTITYGTEETITVVPYDYIKSDFTEEMFGTTDTGEVLLPIKYDQAIGKDDIITYDSNTYRVKRIEKYPFKGGDLLKIVLANKIIN